MITYVGVDDVVETAVGNVERCVSPEIVGHCGRTVRLKYFVYHDGILRSQAHPAERHGIACKYRTSILVSTRQSVQRVSVNISSIISLAMFYMQPSHIIHSRSRHEGRKTVNRKGVERERENNNLAKCQRKITHLAPAPATAYPTGREKDVDKQFRPNFWFERSADGVLPYDDDTV